MQLKFVIWKSDISKLLTVLTNEQKTSKYLEFMKVDEAQFPHNHSYDIEIWSENAEFLKKVLDIMIPEE